MRKSLAKLKAASDAPRRENVPIFKRLQGWMMPKEKPEKRRAYRPRGYLARKVGAAVFWLAFAFMFLVVFFSAIKPSGQTAAQKQQEGATITLNPATTTTAVQYAENFAKEFFTWKPDDEAIQDRKKRLTPFLAKGLDPQAGLQVSGLKTTSTFQKAEIKHIEEKGPNRAYVTLEVFYKLGLPKEVQTTPPSGTDAAASGQTASQPTPTKTIQYEPKEVSKFFVVPVGYEQNYGIYDLPKFTYIDGQTTMKADDRAEGLRAVDESYETKQNVRNFLATFFSSYAADPKDKLGYLLSDPKHQHGLNGTLQFVSVTSAEIYQEGSTKTKPATSEPTEATGSSSTGTATTVTNEASKPSTLAAPAAVGETYIVLCSVMYEDPISKDRFTSNYRLIVSEKEGRYIVSKMDEK
ncbi:conjugal transfer protein [Paenibacillus ehimensis]|uniref:Conjugal transfer protein n=1 Tax=Paenibacillus ehimensis TaxID=79264 RepID=A0ABT8VLF9_9BACL|nr:conjugal transfer protein [Paenibacillus ehimensis]MDO3681821.1 conjugal transfer protein [Paenibacillus ehimensis]